MSDILLFDGRFCPSHPHVRISSPCGVYDAVCNECESAADEAHQQEVWDLMTPDQQKAILAELVECARLRDLRLATSDNEILF